MIEFRNLSKSFGKIQALNDVSATIADGSIYGLVGTNGAGKSTLLRLLAGIYTPDAGSVQIQGQEVFENVAIKQDVFYISDDQFYFANSSMNDMKAYYKGIYPNFSEAIYAHLSAAFDLENERKINTFSKGMARQAFIILALASCPKYLLFDETFDGLDPVMRQAVKKCLASAVAEHHVTPVIASHNLRELEDICDHVGLLHKGGIIFDMELDELLNQISKFQCAFSEVPVKEWFQDLDVLDFAVRGKLCTLVVNEEGTRALKIINAMQPMFAEQIPLSLEEIFIARLEGVGYEITEII